MSHNIALTQVRPSHHATAKLIIDAVDMDTVKDYYPSAALPTNFIELCQIIVKSADQFYRAMPDNCKICQERREP